MGYSDSEIWTALDMSNKNTRGVSFYKMIENFLSNEIYHYL